MDVSRIQLCMVPEHSGLEIIMGLNKTSSGIQFVSRGTE